jgi:hypothetical protein
MFRALKTIRPMPTASGTVMPRALNLSGVSRKDIAATMPNQMNGTAARMTNWGIGAHPSGWLSIHTPE